MNSDDRKSLFEIQLKVEVNSVAVLTCVAELLTCLQYYRIVLEERLAEDLSDVEVSALRHAHLSPDIRRNPVVYGVDVNEVCI